MSGSISTPARALLIGLLALLLSACSSKPETVIEQFYRAAEKNEVEKAIELISFSTVDAGSMVQAKGKIQIIVGEMHNRIEANEGLDKIEIVNAAVDDGTDTAVIQVKVIFNNGKSLTETHRLLKEDGGWKLKLT